MHSALFILHPTSFTLLSRCPIREPRVSQAARCYLCSESPLQLAMFWKPGSVPSKSRVRFPLRRDTVPGLALRHWSLCAPSPVCCSGCPSNPKSKVRNGQRVGLPFNRTALAATDTGRAGPLLARGGREPSGREGVKLGSRSENGWPSWSWQLRRFISGMRVQGFEFL